MAQRTGPVTQESLISKAGDGLAPRAFLTGLRLYLARGNPGVNTYVGSS